MSSVQSNDDSIIDNSLPAEEMQSLAICDNTISPTFKKAPASGSSPAAIAEDPAQSTKSKLFNYFKRLQ